jgi:hypothetical protein
MRSIYVVGALLKFGITYPVVLDNDYATWRAYGNNYWPRKYLMDIYGNIVYDHIGEGAYEETEKKIRELLAERAKFLGERAAAGGKVKVPKFAIVNMAWQGYFVDTEGNTFGVHQPDPRAK